MKAEEVRTATFVALIVAGKSPAEAKQKADEAVAYLQEQTGATDETREESEEETWRRLEHSFALTPPVPLSPGLEALAASIERGRQPAGAVAAPTSAARGGRTIPAPAAEHAVAVSEALVAAGFDSIVEHPTPAVSVWRLIPRTTK